MVLYVNCNFMAARTRQRRTIVIKLRTTRLGTASERLTKYLRKQLNLKDNKSVSKIPAEVAFTIQKMLERAASLSTTPYILQVPGDITKFILQSPAELEYKKARALAIQYDEKFANSIAVMVAERFEAIFGKLHRAFEWAKVSGDRNVLKRIGLKAANEYKQRADSFNRTSFIYNELAVELYRSAIEFAKDSEYVELAKKIGIEAAKRYEEFGDFCVYKPISSIFGLGFGYARAIRWAKACGDEVLADRIRDKVVYLYENYNKVNVINLAFAGAIGDRDQAVLIRQILDNRKKKSFESAGGAT